MTNTSDRFNKLIYDLGYRRQVYRMHNNTSMTIIFDDDDNSITMEGLNQRYKQWLINNNITSKTEFKLNVKLPTYEVHLT